MLRPVRTVPRFRSAAKHAAGTASRNGIGEPGCTARTVRRFAPAADPAPAPAQTDRFEVEAATSLKKRAAEKKGVELIVGGERVAGYVTAIGADSVILTSREHGRIVARRDRIDAVPVPGRSTGSARARAPGRGT